jgi:hypothetical protein
MRADTLEKPGGRGGKERKRDLCARTGLCPFCRYHRGENGPGRRARPDRYKKFRSLFCRAGSPSSAPKAGHAVPYDGGKR